MRPSVTRPQLIGRGRRGSSAPTHQSASHRLALDAEFWPAHYQLAQAYERLGQFDLALQELAIGARLSNSNSKGLSVRGYILARTGRRDGAGDVLRTLEDLSATRYVPAYAWALVLEKAFNERDVHLIFLPVDPKWDPLRKDARFQELLGRCGFT